MVRSSVCPGYVSQLTLNYYLISFSTHMFFPIAILIWNGDRMADIDIGFWIQRSARNRTLPAFVNCKWKALLTYSVHLHIVLQSFSSRQPTFSNGVWSAGKLMFICSMLLRRTSLPSLLRFMTSVLASSIDRFLSQTETGFPQLLADFVEVEELSKGTCVI